MLVRLGLLFTLAPVFRGLIGMLISGAAFPLCGVMVLRMDLVPVRYMLMHGVILGGAIALALSIPEAPVCIIINLLLVLLMIFFNGNSKFGFSGASSAAMVISMALASLIMHMAGVPAKDTLNLIWGSPFTLSYSDLVILAVLSVLLLLYLILNFRTVSALFFNKEIAKSLGMNVRFHNTLMVMIIALVVAVAMKLLGAFMIDSLLILPVLTISSLNLKKSSIKKLFVLSSVAGIIFSLTGYVLAVILNLPPAAMVSLLAGVVYLIINLTGKTAKISR